MKSYLLLAAVLYLVGASEPCMAQGYGISAIRYGTIRDFPLAGLIPGAPESERVDIAMAVWILQSDDRIVLYDTGFHRPPWFDRFAIEDYMRPDSAVMGAGIAPDAVTDIILSHAHWDHMGGIDLFPNAIIWIQEEEYRYYVGDAWQPEGRRGGIDADDIRVLVDRNLNGSVRMVSGDSVEILPGIVVFTGARHTYASQYVMVHGTPAYVLASDNAYFYANLQDRRAGATFLPGDRQGNLDAIDRMLRLGGDVDHVIPGHDALQFERFPVDGRVATVKPRP